MHRPLSLDEDIHELKKVSKINGVSHKIIFEHRDTSDHERPEFVNTCCYAAISI